MSKQIEVVFVKDLAQVAQAGERRMVTSGFWRNYLAPRALAVLPNDRRAKDLLKKLERERAAKEAQPTPAEPVQRPKEQRVARQLAKKQKESKKSARLKAKSSSKKSKEA